MRQAMYQSMVVVATAILTFAFLAACEPLLNAESDIAVESVSFSEPTASLEVGDTLQLSPTVSPDDADNTAVSYSSSDQTVATVSNSGLVTAVAEGTAKITVTTEDGDLTDTIEIVIAAEVIEVTGVSLPESSAALAVGRTYQMNAVVAPSDASNTDLTYASSDDSVATVDADGLVSAEGNGSATITVETVDGGFTADLIVTVITPVTGVTLSSPQTVLGLDQTLQLAATLEPSDASNTGLSWMSSNDTLATVDTDGVVTTLAEGSVTITVRTDDGDYEDTISLTIEAPVAVTSVEIEPPNSSTLEKNETLGLTATVSPSDATDQSVEWTSSDASVLTVNDNGLVNAVGGGSADITVTANDTTNGTITDIVELTVNVPVGGVEVSAPQTTLSTAQSEMQLSVNVSPPDATNTDVSWSTSDDAVATVSNSGLVTAGSTGVTTITAETSDGAFTDSVELTVDLERPQVDSGVFTSSTSLLLSFNEVMKASTLDSADHYTLLDTGNESLAVTDVTLTHSDFTESTLTLTSQPTEGETYTLTVDTSATDLAGNHVSTDDPDNDGVGEHEIELTFYTAPAAIDTSKLSYETTDGTLTAASGAVSFDTGAGYGPANYTVFVLPEGAEATQANALAQALPPMNSDGSISAFIDYDTVGGTNEAYTFSAGTYDAIVALIIDGTPVALSDRRTFTIP